MSTMEILLRIALGGILISVSMFPICFVAENQCFDRAFNVAFCIGVAAISVAGVAIVAVGWMVVFS